MSRFLSAWYTTRLAYGFCVTTAFSCTFPPRLGARPGAAALRAQEMGKTAIMIEERTIGGTCVNRGCLPSKNLIEAARIIHEAQNPRYPGIAPATHGVDFAALIAQKEDVVRRYREKKYESLVRGNVRVVHGHAQFVDEHTVAVDGERFTAQKILIATGSRPVIPEVPGLSQVPYLTSDLLSNEHEVELKHLPNSLAIIGGGYIALELGQMFRRFGAEVTIVERSSQLLARGYEPEVGSTIEEVFRNEGVRVMTGAEPIAVREECGRVIVDVYQKGEQHQIYAEKLLVAAGRRPNTDRIGVEKAGVPPGILPVLTEGHLGRADDHAVRNAPKRRRVPTRLPSVPRQSRQPTVHGGVYPPSHTSASSRVPGTCDASCSTSAIKSRILGRAACSA